MKAHDLIGQQFGMLTVQGKSEKRTPSNKILWDVVCSCGGSALVTTQDLMRKDGKGRVSCGCRNHRRGSKSVFWKSPNEISMRYWSAVKAAAAKRSYSFDLTIEDAFKVFESQQGECALSGMAIELNKTASLDRIDSSQGYHIGNVQWLHKDINRLKSNWPEGQFIELCRRVVDHAGKA